MGAAPNIPCLLDDIAHLFFRLAHADDKMSAGLTLAEYPKQRLKAVAVGLPEVFSLNRIRRIRKTGRLYSPDYTTGLGPPFLTGSGSTGRSFQGILSQGQFKK